jgi:hypothetical protein
MGTLGYVYLYATDYGWLSATTLPAVIVILAFYAVVTYIIMTNKSRIKKNNLEE